MNRAQLLEKLAMELPEWPVTAEQAEMLPEGFYLRMQEVFYPTCPGGGYFFSRNEWLEERTHLVITTSLGASSTACDDQFRADPAAEEEEAFRDCERRMKDAELREAMPGAKEAPAWDGEGDPEQFGDVEIKLDSGEWVEGTFLCRHDGVAIVATQRPDDGFNYFWRYWAHLRPIRSEEDRFVDGVNEVMEEEGLFSLDRHARALYRVGYHKPAEA